MNNETWQDRFDKLGGTLTLSDNQCGDLKYCDLSHWFDIRDFIQSERNLVQQEERERILTFIESRKVDASKEACGDGLEWGVKTMHNGQMQDIQDFIKTLRT